MKVADEIEKWACESHKKVLRFILKKYSWSSQYYVLVKVNHEPLARGRYAAVHVPTIEAAVIYNHFHPDDVVALTGLLSFGKSI
jgi:hypothetical protein